MGKPKADSSKTSANNSSQNKNFSESSSASTRDGVKKRGQSPSTKRRLNNLNERARICILSETYEELKLTLPSDRYPNEKMSRDSIVKYTNDYIRYLVDLYQRRLRELLLQKNRPNNGDDFLNQLQFVKNKMGNEWKVGQQAESGTASSARCSQEISKSQVPTSHTWSMEHNSTFQPLCEDLQQQTAVSFDHHLNSHSQKQQQTAVSFDHHLNSHGQKQQQTAVSFDHHLNSHGQKQQQAAVSFDHHLNSHSQKQQQTAVSFDHHLNSHSQKQQQTAVSFDHHLNSHSQTQQQTVASFDLHLNSHSQTQHQNSFVQPVMQQPQTSFGDLVEPQTQHFHTGHGHQPPHSHAQQHPSFFEQLQQDLMPPQQLQYQQIQMQHQGEQHNHYHHQPQQQNLTHYQHDIYANRQQQQADCKPVPSYSPYQQQWHQYQYPPYNNGAAANTYVNSMIGFSDYLI